MRLEERISHLENTLGTLMTLYESGIQDEDLIQLIRLQLTTQKEEDKENINLELFLYFDKHCRELDLVDLQGNVNIQFTNCTAGTLIDTFLEKIIISFLFKRFSEKIKLIKDGQQS